MADGINPAIALEAGKIGMPGAGGFSAQVMNPLEAFKDIVGIQGSLLQQRQIEQEFQARTKAGQYLSAMPLDQAFQMMQHDPLIAPFAGKIINETIGWQKGAAELANLPVAQAQTGFVAFLQGMPALDVAFASGDRARIESAIRSSVNMGLSATTPIAHNRFIDKMNSVKEQILGGIDWENDPNAAMKARQNLTGLMIESGLKPNDIYTVRGMPQPETREIQLETGEKVPASVSTGWGGLGTPTTTPALMGPQPAEPTAVPVPVAPAPAPTTAPGAGGSEPPTAAPGATRRLGFWTPENQAQVDIAKKVEESMQADFSEAGKGINQSLLTFDKLQDSLQKMTAGGLTPARAEFARLAEGVGNVLGMDRDKLREMRDKILGGSLTSYDQFTAFINPYALNVLRENVKGTGRVMRSEVDVFLSMLNAAKDPQALMEAINFGRDMTRTAVDKINKWPQFQDAMHKRGSDIRTQYGNVGNFEVWYGNTLKDRDTRPKTFGGLSLMPRPITEAQTSGVPKPPIESFFPAR